MGTTKWHTQKVYGRDQVLRDIQERANAHSDMVVQDVRAVMHDYEVDMYRLVLAVGKRYGLDTAYEIMSETVAEKRLRWLDQVRADLELAGTDVEQGLGLYRKYFRPQEGDLRITEQAAGRVVFKRRDFVNAIAHACDALGLDVITVNNQVYARTMNLMFERVGLRLQHVFLKYHDGWYDEMIVSSASK
ncbi:MAG TPA: hypothetical protein PLG21_14170 [Anaerolineae bacterium]|nr:hypothetical protein [Anaerolineae bacterium]